MTTTEKTIAGHVLNLTPGVRYRASRPFAGWGGQRFTVTISRIDGCHPLEATKIRDLSYDDANDLLDQFNNGASSFDGRVW